MPFSRQYFKNSLLYALIGLFAVGGVTMYSVKTAHAAQFNFVWDENITMGGTVVASTTGSGYYVQCTHGDIFYGSCTALHFTTETNWVASTQIGVMLEANNPTWLYHCTNTVDSSTYADCIIQDSGGYEWFSSGNQVTPVTEVTHFLSESISTTTRTVVVTGVIAPGDLSKTVNYSLNISTPIWPTWDQDSFIATTSGFFSHSFEYRGSFASTTIEQFTFSGQLYYFTGNPFTDASSTIVLDTFSTTTFPGLASDFTAAEIEQGIADNCKPFSSFWSVGLCIQYLVYPSTAQVTQNLNDIKQTFLTKMPMGYITRLVQIVAASTTTPLPTLSYTWASDGGPLAGKTLSFDTGTYFAQAAALNSEMTSNTDHKTAWQIFEPVIDIFLAIVLIFGMIHDISGLPLIHHKK